MAEPESMPALMVKAVGILDEDEYVAIFSAVPSAKRAGRTPEQLRDLYRKLRIFQAKETHG